MELEVGREVGLGRSLMPPHSDQNSGQTVKSLNVNLPFMVVTKVSLSRQETFSLLA